MWGLIGEVKYACKQCATIACKSIQEFSCTIIDTDLVDEDQYQALMSCSCQQCSNNIELRFKIIEYPLGKVNNITDISTGAKALTQPDVEYLRAVYAYSDLSELNGPISQLGDYLTHQATQLSESNSDQDISHIFTSKGFVVNRIKGQLGAKKELIALHTQELKNKYIIEYTKDAQATITAIRFIQTLTNSRNKNNTDIYITNSIYSNTQQQFFDHEESVLGDLTVIAKKQLLNWLAT